jgi:hypothetical protein
MTSVLISFDLLLILIVKLICYSEHHPIGSIEALLALIFVSFFFGKASLDFGKLFFIVFAKVSNGLVLLPNDWKQTEATNQFCRSVFAGKIKSSLINTQETTPVHVTIQANYLKPRNQVVASKFVTRNLTKQRTLFFVLQMLIDESANYYLCQQGTLAMLSNVASLSKSKDCGRS